MDEDGGNVECIGHLNLAWPAPGHPQGRPASCQLAGVTGPAQPSPVGRLVDSPRRHELGAAVQRVRDRQRHGRLGHFQTQISDGHIVFESYYNLNNAGFGSLYKFPGRRRPRATRVGPGHMQDPRNAALRHGATRTAAASTSALPV